MSVTSSPVNARLQTADTPSITVNDPGNCHAQFQPLIQTSEFEDLFDRNSGNCF